jgi:hypothetical protein
MFTSTSIVAQKTLATNDKVISHEDKTLMTILTSVSA